MKPNLFGIADFAASRVWGDCLNALLFSIIFLVALQLEDLKSLGAWLRFGLLAGGAALACPPILLVALFLIAWICYRSRQRGTPRGWSAGLAMLMPITLHTHTPNIDIRLTRSSLCSRCMGRRDFSLESGAKRNGRLCLVNDLNFKFDYTAVKRIFRKENLRPCIYCTILCRILSR